MVSVIVKAKVDPSVMPLSLTTARIPSRLEPSGLQCSDGKCPDGVTMVPWRSGIKALSVGCNQPRHFFPAYISGAQNMAGTGQKEGEVYLSRIL